MRLDLNPTLFYACTIPFTRRHIGDFRRHNKKFIFMEQLIFHLPGRENQGKTSSLLELVRLIDADDSFRAYPKKERHDEGKNPSDVLAIYDTYNGLRIAIITQGDPLSKYSSQEKWLKMATEKQCHIIVCASRTRGSSYELVYSFAKQYHYRVMLISNIRPSRRRAPSVRHYGLYNRASAEGFFAMLKHIINNYKTEQP